VFFKDRRSKIEDRFGSVFIFNKLAKILFKFRCKRFGFSCKRFRFSCKRFRFWCKRFHFWCSKIRFFAQAFHLSSNPKAAIKTRICFPLGPKGIVKLLHHILHSYLLGGGFSRLSAPSAAIRHAVYGVLPVVRGALTVIWKYIS
jgi:hypothetical protein